MVKRKNQPRMMKKNFIDGFISFSVNAISEGVPFEIHGHILPAIE